MPFGVRIYLWVYLVYVHRAFKIDGSSERRDWYVFRRMTNGDSGVVSRSAAPVCEARDLPSRARANGRPAG